MTQENKHKKAVEKMVESSHKKPRKTSMNLKSKSFFPKKRKRSYNTKSGSFDSVGSSDSSESWSNSEYEAIHTVDTKSY